MSVAPSRVALHSRGLQRRHRWLVFLGDSDTRGLVLALLQVLAEAGVGAEAAAGNMSHWFGDGLNVSAAPPGQTQAQAQRLAAARICHMDWSYDERGRVVSRRTWPCLAARRPSAKEERVPSGGALAFMKLQRDGARAMAALSCLALVTLLPIYVRGANYYTCGEPLMHTSLAYLADAPALTAAPGAAT